MPMENYQLILSARLKILAVFSAEQFQEGKYQYRIVKRYDKQSQ